MLKNRYPNLVAELARTGYTRKEIAQKMKMSLSSLQRRLSGHAEFRLNDIYSLCEIFGKSLSIDYLLSSESVLKRA